MTNFKTINQANIVRETQSAFLVKTRVENVNLKKTKIVEIWVPKSQLTDWQLADWLYKAKTKEAGVGFPGSLILDFSFSEGEDLEKQNNEETVLVENMKSPEYALKKITAGVEVLEKKSKKYLPFEKDYTSRQIVYGWVNGFEVIAKKSAVKKIDGKFFVELQDIEDYIPYIYKTIKKQGFAPCYKEKIKVFA